MRRVIPTFLALFTIIALVFTAVPALAAPTAKPATTTKVHTAKTPHAKKKDGRQEEVDREARRS